MSVCNLQRVFALASQSDIETGLSAFETYNKLVSEIAEKTGYTPETGAAVFSALSPNNDYFGNLRDTHRLLAAAKAGLAVDEFRVSTYGKNKQKAWLIAKGEDPRKLITADKTRNFFLNVSNPVDPAPVTIDGHMFNIWNGTRQKLVGLSVRKGDYKRVADDVRNLAGVAGLRANQMQAILWHTWRRIHGIRTASQMSFWDEAALAAKLGYYPCQPCRLSDQLKRVLNLRSSEFYRSSQPNGIRALSATEATDCASSLLNSRHLQVDAIPLSELKVTVLR